MLGLYLIGEILDCNSRRVSLTSNGLDRRDFWLVGPLRPVADQFTRKAAESLSSQQTTSDKAPLSQAALTCGLASSFSTPNLDSYSATTRLSTAANRFAA